MDGLVLAISPKEGLPNDTHAMMRISTY